jgi:UDP-N-acetyl-D-mannosaminuronic acid dehydrogenase
LTPDPRDSSRFDLDLAVIGGCGRVGLPLGITFAGCGQRVVLVDIDRESVDAVNRARMPFEEPGADELLATTIAGGHLRATTAIDDVSRAEHVVLVIGTPVDEHLDPDLHAVNAAVDTISDRLVDGQLLVLRSTVYPGVTAMVERQIARLGLDVDVAFCPERVAEGRAIRELRTLPQIVASRSAHARARATKLFEEITEQIVHLEPEEAELAKLFANAWRYIKFATANQLFMIANDFGLDYGRIHEAVTYKYPRALDLPGAGFAAGPCLLKDMLQLSAFSHHEFELGRASIKVNEGLPMYVVARLEQRFDLQSMTVGILGMAFKGGSDDARSSLSYELKRILSHKAARVITHDAHVTTDPELVSLDEVLRASDLLVIGTPHPEYRELETTLPVIDVSNLRRGGAVV